MTVSQINNTHLKLCKVLESYLGPAANRFVERQIKFHLQKPPQDVTRDDIPELTEWIKISMALLTEDRNSIDECEQKLLELGR